ncbi:MAG TPA: nuclear transport factor 2 family protein [Pyrinomonadaceae bacterium]|jgi:ketosteroid isomerase-like protein
MQEKEPITSVNHSTRTEPIDAERTVAAPHFDAAAVKQARPAVPLAEIRAKRSWPVMLMALAVLAGLAGGVIGGVLSTGYLRRDTAQPAASQESTSGMATTATDKTADSVPANQAAPEANPVEQQPSSTAPEAALEREAKAGEEAKQQTLRETSPAETEAALRAALNEWVAATNARDLGKQLSFYTPTMNAFYRRRNASLEEVRADRARVFENAQSIDVRADAPVIRVSRDGQSATMRFIKSYSIVGGGEDRNGMVVQELRWERVNGQWRIVSERDIKVVR